LAGGRAKEAAEQFAALEGTSDLDLADRIAHASALAAAGEAERADRLLRECVAVAGDSVELHRARAAFLRQSQRPAEAIRSYQRVLELVPHDTQALLALSKL